MYDLDTMAETLNAMAEQAMEYETTHKDSGDARAHMPRESWSIAGDIRLAAYMKDKGIDWAGLEIDDIADSVLDTFKMESGHIFSDIGADFIVDSYPVGEIEMQIDSDVIGTPWTPELCESLSRCSDVYLRYQDADSAFGYLGSDSVWLASVSEKAMRELVRELKRA